MTRFPDFPPDILDRADALLSARYGTDKPIDPLLVEIACEAMMAQREFDAGKADEISKRFGERATDWIDPCEAIAKAIRGTK